MLSSISSLEELNQITYHDFINNESLVEFNHFSAYLINAELITQFRIAHLNGQTLGNFIYAHAQQSNITLEDMSTSADSVALYDLYNAGFTNKAYFIPFSKKDFVSSYFSNMTPQLAESVFNLMKTTGRLIQIGSGGGKAFILKPIEFTETHFQSLPVFKTNQQLLDIAQETITLLKTQVKDADYYLQKIAERDELIEQLNQHIIELNNKINQVYQTTWR